MPASKLRLLLSYGPELVDGAPLFVSSNSSPLPWARKEPAGLSFHKAALRKTGYGDTEEIDPSGSEKKQKLGAPSVDSYHFKGKKKSTTDGEQQDHYALLGLSHLRFLATEEQIRKSYRDVALKHHPDKQAMLLLQEETLESREAKKDEIDRHFKSIQEAYEVLMDPNKRRLYDSIDEFDDEVPSDCSPEDFFEVFGPVFLRNGRWSITQPVPSLGEGSTSIADVDGFYDFWWSFKSWREFPHADEFDVEQAESREHKRWMERQNGKLREKAKREENGRIRMLIENAYKRDPRILKRKEEAKAEKLRKKQERVLAKQEKELEAARLVEEERLRKLEEDRKVALEVAAQKKVREKEKKVLRKERQRLRAAAAAVSSQKLFRISDEAIESLCTTLELAEMTVLCQKLEDKKSVEEQAEILRGSLRGSEYDDFDSDSPSDRPSGRFDQTESTWDGNAVVSVESQLKLDSRQPNEAVANGNGPTHRPEHKSLSAVNGGDKKEKPWTKEEVELLRKAVAKYPKGTSQRWEVVSSYLGTGRTVDEILRAIKSVLLQKPDSSKAFDSFLSKRKQAKGIASPLSTRDEVPDVRAGSPSIAPPLSDSTGKIDRPCFDVKECETRTQECHVEKGASCGLEVLDNVTGDANESTATGDQDIWTEMQELALVKALKTFPKDMTQRWERIAAAVPSKTKAQCFKKFTELRENFRSKRGTEYRSPN